MTITEKMKNLTLEIADLEKQLEDMKTEFKNNNLAIVQEEGYSDEFVKVTWVKPSESVSVDLKKFEKAEKEEYDLLLADYPKVTKKVGYPLFKFTKDK